jgi:hypothetical protein
VAKNEDWKQLYNEDWTYVSSMTRFFKWWIKHEFHVDVAAECDILPVIPGRIFDRPSIAYLLKDHSERGRSVFHFYLPYFKPIFTDCRPIDAYHSNNFGMVTWHRPKPLYLSSDENEKYFADSNCDGIHKLWDLHIRGTVPFLYFNRQFNRVSRNDEYRFVTIDLAKL